ncbi:NADH dehydrogenase subunit 1 (mitochondrion) [Colletotrichum acutatum]|uniref:NADH-ubiquinone oxidoreductase chain 1 n=4 Tax=Colletotrichum acutatum species complex TaxID=2707335 RepID=A0A0U2IL31_9PEZI|nr:NADH dehydrogenase subunit 1 [Colletotrichum acutatum]YP_009228731.1 NADH dehydrogenase subunit 1 [Colletotrichum lupini]YP_009239412.1 NADH dehydrogenase subunit 1 [Colletotrichum tamarilloi]YP_009251091.1 NADH dehydrogenase subunit 1 [Colletotrichum fioriniae]YP_010845850.1 NADH dehydrogenase subunit 1 [Pholiota spumosa]AKJ86842.1 NADH dehydrogenase subunit 1 [Colletotrichum acutatum]ALS19911.1 NADH dehydrogenase subunit 1 [Colletotrichum lupini]AMM05385.1 NADH dehydrogenase subunit 1 [
MYYTSTLLSVLEVVLLMLPALLAVAYVTVAERKTMASMQRRLGPNAVGYYGLLQAFADALKLILKEYVAPTQANTILFFLGPVITLAFALLGYGVVPYGPGLTLNDLELGIFYMLAVSSLGTYGILLAGWSANSKYAFLGSLRSTAQLISYELVLSSAILLIIMITSSLNLNINIQAQKAVWLILPIFPIFLIFFIGSVAETNRAPFDLAEAESELVSGFMTEHAAVVFVFFFLAEYGSILLMCILTSILFLGGYLAGFNLLYWFNLINNLGAYVFDIDWVLSAEYNNMKNFVSAFAESGLFSSLILGAKSSLLVFIFIWVRASFPRIRFDQLMSFCWTVLLPLLFAFIILLPCTLYALDIFVINITI